MRQSGLDMVRLNARAHIYVRPSARAEIVDVFARALGCGRPMELPNPGQLEPIIAFRFPGGGSVSFEFTGEALSEPQLGRGAWLEIEADDLGATRRVLADLGLAVRHHPATSTTYFVLPGGQVVGVVQRPVSEEV